MWDVFAWVGMVVLGLVVLTGILHWMAFVFEWGRYRRAQKSTVSTLSSARPALWMVAAEFFIKLINDFRHLLALSVILMFGAVTGLLLFPGLWNLEVEAMAEGLEAVAASLGTLVASVIGYYFGESAGKRGRVEETKMERAPEAVVQRGPSDPSGPLPVGPPKPDTNNAGRPI